MRVLSDKTSSKPGEVHFEDLGKIWAVQFNLIISNLIIRSLIRHDTLCFGFLFLCLALICFTFKGKPLENGTILRKGTIKRKMT